MIEIRGFIQKNSPNIFDGTTEQAFIISETTTTGGICFDDYNLPFVNVVDEMDGEVTESEYDEQGRCYYHGGRDQGSFTFELDVKPKEGYHFFEDEGNVTISISDDEARLIVKDLNEFCEIQVDSYENND